MARQSLRRHPLRSILTMLGVIIGVASVVAMIALGAGASTQVRLEMERLGTNLLLVNPAPTARERRQGDNQVQLSLTESDAVALVNEVFSIDHAVPVVRGTAQLVSGNHNWSTTLIGSYPDYVPARDWQVVHGRNFTLREVAASANVALVGKTVEDELSPLQPLLGKVVRIAGVPFRVIGVLAEKGQLFNGTDQDDLVVIPISSAKSRLMGGYFRLHHDAAAYIMVKARSGELDIARKSIERVLSHRHAVLNGVADDFVVRDPTASLAAQRSASETMALLLACVAAVSLLVGGISIMNITLVSVMERTREIGIRTAVGATRSDIRNQFLLEAAGVSLTGGAIGVVVGVAGAYLLEAVTGWRVQLETWMLVAPLAVSGIVGFASGFYPAMKAAAQDPWEAIRN
jgi:putative ABC transport system permease protein